MAKLVVGERVPEFVAQTLSGNTLTPAQFAGRRILLSFRRYAACPVCNQHLATFRVRAATELRPRGIEMYAVFHSPVDRLLRYFEPAELPFGVIADPEFELYQTFGVIPSRQAALHPGTVAAVVSALFSGQGSRSPADADGTSFMVPANFMIDDAKIGAAHYGKHLGDAWSVEQVIDVADELWGSPEHGRSE